MSCRRSERRRLIGCHIGEVALRGCRNGCCGFWGPEGVEEHERINYASRPPIRFKPPTTRQGQPEHIWHCRVAGRAKSVCLDCCRVFKPAFLDGNDYEAIGPTHEEWIVRPAVRGERMRTVVNASTQLQRADRKLTAEERELRKRAQAAVGEFRGSGYNARPAGWEQLKDVEPELWFQRLGTRCPGCGTDGTPVGGNFRAPKQSDHHGWADIRRRLADGQTFRPCATHGEEAELWLEGKRLAARQASKSTWEQEKAERLRSLGLAVKQSIGQ